MAQKSVVAHVPTVIFIFFKVYSFQSGYFFKYPFCNTYFCYIFPLSKDLFPGFTVFHYAFVTLSGLLFSGLFYYVLRIESHQILTGIQNVILLQSCGYSLTEY